MRLTMAKVLIIDTMLVYFFLNSTAICKLLNTTVERTSSGIENPCHLKLDASTGSIAHVDDNVTDHSLIIRIISDHSSGLIIKSLGLAGTATYFKQFMESEYTNIQSYMELKLSNSTYPVSCTTTQHINETEIIECLLSSYDVLKNFSESIDVIYRTAIQSTNVASAILKRLVVLQDEINTILCSMMSNGFGKLSRLAGLATSPIDIVENISKDLNLSKVLRMIYQLTDVVWSTSTGIHNEVCRLNTMLL